MPRNPAREEDSILLGIIMQKCDEVFILVQLEGVLEQPLGIAMDL